MGNDVFANGREVSCKAADGKSICAFPDVCFTPPTTPATPPGVPIPYPNTAFAKDTTKGSKKVKISGKEVMLKNKSYFKKSTGDEAGSAPKKGVITSTNRGKVYFTSWSMDVKFEGQNVVRHLDLTTHNHMSMPGNTPPFPHIDTMATVVPSNEECKECQEAAHANTTWAKKMQGEYANAAKDPANVSGDDIDKAVAKSLASQGIQTEVAGTTDADANITVEKREGPCARLEEKGTEVHETVHRQHTLDLQKKHGKNTAAFNKAWNDGKDWAQDEVNAYGAEVKFWERFRQDCQGRGS